MVALLFLFLDLLISPLKRTSRLEAENAALRHLCVPKTLSALMRRENHLILGDDCAVMAALGHPGFAIQIEMPVCAENVIRIDLATESHDHRGNGRAAVPFSQPADRATQAEEPA
jgi:hypothetical protein